MRSIATLAVVITLIVLAGCAGSPSGQGTSPATESPAPTATPTESTTTTPANEETDTQTEVPTNTLTTTSTEASALVGGFSDGEDIIYEGEAYPTVIQGAPVEITLEVLNREKSDMNYTVITQLARVKYNRTGGNVTPNVLSRQTLDRWTVNVSEGESKKVTYNVTVDRNETESQFFIQALFYKSEPPEKPTLENAHPTSLSFPINTTSSASTTSSSTTTNQSQ